jgi:hypothetical protein
MSNSNNIPSGVSDTKAYRLSENNTGLAYSAEHFTQTNFFPASMIILANCTNIQRVKKIQICNL